MNAWSQPLGQGVPCLYYDYFLLNAAQGSELIGQFDLLMPGRAIHFFILYQAQFRGFEGSNCYWNWSWELHAYAASYGFDWVVPQTGEYALLFLSTTFYGGTILLKMEAHVPSSKLKL
jgi:hypothetical protein